jgi:3-methyladenine DNA glycosylase/8-oxoguanine DNA glycosylase
LRKSDPKLASIIKKIGPFDMKMRDNVSVFHSLIRSILFQQLNGRAAATIHSRVRAIFSGRDPEPAELLAVDDALLAAAGVSRNKRLALKDLARAAEEGQLPEHPAMAMMSDEDIIERLVPIRGIGRWTVEMLLIFTVGRLDVLAVDDFALKKSLMLLYKMKEMPNRKKFHQIGEKWRPYRTLACWYLWRALD